MRSSTRLNLRGAVEQELREERLTDDQIAACFASVAGDPGPIDLNKVFGPPTGGHYPERKAPAPERSL